MKLRLILRPEARLDIDETVFWYEDQRSGLGTRFTEELDQLFRRIVDSPVQFPSVAPDTRRGLLHRFPYAVYFAVGRENVAVIAVLHQHRDPRVWKQRT